MWCPPQAAAWVSAPSRSLQAAGNTRSTTACPTGFQAISAPAPGAPPAPASSLTSAFAQLCLALFSSQGHGTFCRFLHAFSHRRHHLGGGAVQCCWNSLELAGTGRVRHRTAPASPHRGPCSPSTNGQPGQKYQKYRKYIRNTVNSSQEAVRLNSQEDKKTCNGFTRLAPFAMGFCHQKCCRLSLFYPGGEMWLKT